MLVEQNITEHFKVKELKCKCCNTIPKDVYENLKLLCNALEELRMALGKPITVISGYRCPARNKVVGGAPKSQHVLGKAADIMVKDMTPEQVAKAADKIKAFRGIGTYSTFTHVDIRKSLWKAQWRK